MTFLIGAKTFSLSTTLLLLGRFLVLWQMPSRPIGELRAQELLFSKFISAKARGAGVREILSSTLEAVVSRLPANAGICCGTILAFRSCQAVVAF